VRAWAALRPSSVESRFDALHISGLTEVVGREEELEILLRRWSKAKSGEGQVVLLSGEPGIGKSRLTAALLERLAPEPHTRIRSFCSSQHTDSALFPIINQMERAAGFARDDNPQAKLDKLDTMLAQSSTSAQDAAVLAELLSLPNDGRYPTPEVTPQQRRQKTLQALVSQVLALSSQNPVLMNLEDAHWIDPTSLELFGKIVGLAPTLRMLLIATYRPDFEPPWIGLPHVTTLILNRLGEREIGAMIDSITGNRSFPASIRQEIIERSDGIPLFVEEMTKAVLEAESEAAYRHAAAGIPSPSLAVPVSLHASLMARLDRLSEAREVAQIASVIGRQFSFSLLDAVAPRRSAKFEDAVAKLTAAGIIFPVGSGLEANFSFKHALVRDAAYESLLLGRRREWHMRIARALEEHLAYHFGETGLASTTSDYRMRAGDRAVSRSAYKEAASHHKAGMEATKALPPEEGRAQQLRFLLKLGTALTVTQGAQGTETEAAYRQADQVAEAIGDAGSAYKAKWGLWLGANLGRKTAAARDRAEELVMLAERMGDDDLQLEAYHCRWSTAFFRGDVDVARRNSEVGIARYQPARHHDLAAAFGGHDPGVCANVILALTNSLTSEQQVAWRQIENAIKLAETLDHPFSQAHALMNAAMARQLAWDREGAEDLAERTIALTDKYGFQPYRLGGLILRAWAQGSLHYHAESIELVEREIERAIAVGPNGQQLLGLAAEIMLAANRHTEAMALLHRALSANEEAHVGYYLVEIHRLRGECLLALDRDNEGEAQQAFVTARDIASRQGAINFAHRSEACLIRVNRI
jgi:AAA ATPase domain